MTRQEFQHSIVPLKDKLYRFALSLMSNIPEAEDVVQEVFIKLWQQRERLSEISNMEAWTVKMTKNVSIDKIRARKRTEDVATTILFQKDDGATPAELAEQSDTVQYIQSIMNQLPEKQRLVMHLRDIEEYSYQEIAVALELPLDQVKVNLFRARKYIREQIQQSGVFQK